MRCRNVRTQQTRSSLYFAQESVSQRQLGTGENVRQPMLVHVENEKKCQSWEFVRTGQNVLFCIIPKWYDSLQVYERSRVRERVLVLVTGTGTGAGFSLTSLSPKTQHCDANSDCSMMSSHLLRLGGSHFNNALRKGNVGFSAASTRMMSTTKMEDNFTEVNLC